MKLLLFPVVLLFLIIGASFFIPVFSPRPSTAVGNAGLASREKLNFWGNQIRSRGPEAAYQGLKNTYATAHFSTQHLASHIFGEELYETAGEDGVAVCDDVYAFGCFHGFFSAAVRDQGEKIISKLDAVCRKRESLGWITACQHGLGHGIIEYTGSKRLLDALGMCSKVQQENPFYGCSSGIFMEYNMPVEIGSEKAVMKFRDLDQHSPYFPCDTLSDPFFKKSCYYELAHWWDKVYEKNYQKIGELCMSIKDSQDREACAIGMGNVAAPSSNYDAVSTAKKCRVLLESYYALCISEAAQNFKSRPGAGDLVPPLDKF